MSPLEWVAAALLLINVWLAAQRSLWNYAFALAAVSLYLIIFYEARLYSDAALQLIFIALNLYGLWNWRQAAKGGAGPRVDAENQAIPVGWMGGAARAGWAAAMVGLWLAWSSAMAHFTDAAVPYIDGAVLVMSVAAQWLMARRRVESWWLWVAVDLVAVPLYASRDLYVTGGVYLILLIIAVRGAVQWRRAAGRTELVTA
ncbi:nicotinamide riboside transporter PnuC [Sphingopyxis yananensis]|uniref:nicotinamide riboside transporter PnuC n=1 Tax=Sphingopyxis yananensis TaxID=2886687 RepID=UPI001D10DA77|nr:nicotinamide riboside transporter PnuC [Sphingopyxis yananensis]MCC2601676.1 nicotinamide riboside transporter PnuC [Sphingopyxis yananensis]